MFIKRLPRESEIREGDDLEIGCIIEEVKLKEKTRAKGPCKYNPTLSFNPLSKWKATIKNHFQINLM
jgi:hypothetical protein